MIASQTNAIAVGRWRVLVLTLTAVSAASFGGGCGGSAGGLERVVVSGNVSYRGEPVAKGQIRFLPVDGTEAYRSGAQITDGRYVCRSKGGVPVGTHRVEIAAYRQMPHSSGPPSLEMDLGGPPTEQYLPARYNEQSELRVEIVAANDAVTHDFELTGENNGE